MNNIICIIIDDADDGNDDDKIASAIPTALHAKTIW